MKDTKDQHSTILIDPGKLPIWPIMVAMQVSYLESVVRLQNALSLTEYMALPNFSYRFTVNDPTTGEIRAVVEQGSDGVEPAQLPYEIAISILTIIRLKDYVASYGKSRVISVFFSGAGDEDRASDMDRMLILFDERPEFEMYKLSRDIRERSDGKETEGSEETASPAPEAQETHREGLDHPNEDVSQLVRDPYRPKLQ